MSIEYQFRCQYNKGRGDCLFLAIEQAIRNVRKNRKMDDHTTIRRKVVTFVTKQENWEANREHIISTHMDTLSFFKTIVDKGLDNITNEDNEAAIETYRKYMSRKGIYGTFIELFAAGNIYNFNFVIVQQLNANPKEALVSIHEINKKSSWKYFIFSGPYESGHWENASLLRKRIVYPRGSYIIVGRKDDVLTIKTNYKHGRSTRKRKHDGTNNPNNTSKCSKKNAELMTEVWDMPYKQIKNGIHFSPITTERFILKLDPQARKECTMADRKMGLHLIKGSSKVHVLNTKSVIDLKVKKCEINIDDEYMIYNDSDDISYVCIDILSESVNK